MKKNKVSKRKASAQWEKLLRKPTPVLFLSAGILGVFIFALLIATPPFLKKIFNQLESADSISSIRREATVTGSTGTTRTASVSTATLNAGVNLMYIASISTKPNIPVSSVSGLGLTWNRVTAQCGGRGLSRTETWWAYGSTVSSGMVTANFANSSNLESAVITATTYSGAIASVTNATSRNSIGIGDSTCTGGQAKSTYSLPITANITGSLVFSTVSIRTRRHTALNGFTEISEVHSPTNSSDMSGIATMEKIVTSPGVINAEGKINSNVDYAVVGFIIHPASSSPGPTPTPVSNSTPSNTPVPTSAAPSPTPLPLGGYIWISPTELATIPIAGQTGCDSFCLSAWNAIVNKANSTWHAPNLSEYTGVQHSQEIWAGAVAAVKLATVPGKEADAQRFREKTLNGLQAVIGTEQAALPENNGGIDDGRLAIARQFLRYVTAANILGVHNWGAGYKGYRNYVEYMLKTKFVDVPGDGGKTMAEMHKCASNGCAMGGGSRIASAAYLGDRTELDDAWNTFRRYTGDTSSSVNMFFSATGQNWYHNNTSKVAINPKGTTCAGTSYPADGVIPNDQGRGGLCPSDPNNAPGYTQYPWEGLQGIYSQAVILHRLGYKDASGKNPWQINDAALKRALEYQWYLQNRFGGSWYDVSRAAWVKHLAFRVYGIKPLQYSSTDGGRNMSLTQWTHLNYSP